MVLTVCLKRIFHLRKGTEINKIELFRTKNALLKIKIHETILHQEQTQLETIELIFFAATECSELTIS